MVPVPMTLQSLVVISVGLLCGARLGTATILCWLALAGAGLPVLSGDAGPAAFTGATAGYLASFPLVAGALGVLADAGRMRSVPIVLAAALAGHALILALGWARLQALLGPAEALAVGVRPFLLGAVVKSAGATGIWWLLRWPEPGFPSKNT